MSVMRRNQMARVMREELARIPRGDLNQNVLRAIYNMQRRHDLASSPAAPKEVALRVAIEDVRKSEPSFVPQYDRGFFSL